jgi:hypothetical protein
MISVASLSDVNVTVGEKTLCSETGDYVDIVFDTLGGSGGDWWVSGVGD